MPEPFSPQDYKIVTAKIEAEFARLNQDIVAACQQAGPLDTAAVERANARADALAKLAHYVVGRKPPGFGGA